MLFALLALNWLSGVGFFVFNRWITVEGDFGPQHHPWQHLFLKVHGGAAFLMMIAYGYLLASHVPSGWKTRRARTLGLTLVSVQGFLIVTAYILYYVAGEDFRQWVGYAHASVGFLFPFLLASHVYSGLRWRRHNKAPVSPPPSLEGLDTAPARSSSSAVT